MKVKIITNQYYEELENIVNDFIKDKDIIDIKYIVACSNVKSCLIMYK